MSLNAPQISAFLLHETDPPPPAHDIDAERAAAAAAGHPPDSTPPVSLHDPRALASPLGSRRRYFVVAAVHEAEVPLIAQKASLFGGAHPRAAVVASFEAQALAPIDVAAAHVELIERASAESSNRGGGGGAASVGGVRWLHATWDRELWLPVWLPGVQASLALFSLLFSVFLAPGRVGSRCNR